MATAKKTAAKTAPPTKTASPAGKAIKPVKESFTKSSLATHLAAQSGVEPKAEKAVLAALEATVLGAVHKKGARGFALPGLLKIGVQQGRQSPNARASTVRKVERVFATKPASVRSRCVR